MRMLMLSLLVPSLLIFAGCSSSVESGLSIDEAKVNLLQKTESQYRKLVEKVDSGQVPDDIGRLSREVSALGGLLSEELSPLGKKLVQQVDAFETLISAKSKPTVAKAKESLDEIGATIEELKSKL